MAAPGSLIPRPLWHHVRRPPPTLHRWMSLSVEQVANELLLRQSTSRVGAAWQDGVCNSLQLCNRPVHTLHILGFASGHQGNRQHTTGLPGAQTADAPQKAPSTHRTYPRPRPHQRPHPRPHPPECSSYTCLASPDLASHTTAVLSTLPDSSRSPRLFHLSAKMGPWCRSSVCFSLPAAGAMKHRHWGAFFLRSDEESVVFHEPGAAPHQVTRAVHAPRGYPLTHRLWTRCAQGRRNPPWPAGYRPRSSPAWSRPCPASWPRPCPCPWTRGAAPRSGVGHRGRPPPRVTGSRCGRWNRRTCGGETRQGVGAN